MNSLDLTPPRVLKIAGSTGMVNVPIAILSREVKHAWWVTDGHGDPLTVVSRNLSSRLVREMLVSALSVMGLLEPATSVAYKQAFAFIDNSEALSPLPIDAVFEQYPELNRQDSTTSFVRQLIEKIATSWVVLVEIPESNLGRRSIIKYGYDWSLDKRRRDLFIDNDSYSIEVDDPGFSHSLHHEVRVPADLVVFEASLEQLLADGRQARIRAKSSNPGPVSHVQNLEFMPRLAEARLEYRVRPVADGIHLFTGWTLLFVGMLVLFSIAVHIGPTEYYLHDGWSSSISVAAILVGPALFLSWLARVPEAQVVATSLLRLRVVNILLSFVMLSMAAALSVSWTPGWWWIIWGTSYMFYACAVILWFVEKHCRKKTVYKDLYKS